jgi:predicted nucleotidyltransferase
MTTVTRRSMIDALVAALQPRADVNAAWLGGSDAFGRADELSDVDLCVDVADGSALAVLDAVEDALRTLSPIRARYDVPEPSWHGHAQRFYRLTDAPETLLLDVAAMERSNQRMRFSEREAHGEPVVLFDKIGVVRSTSLDAQQNAEAMRARRTALRAREAIFGGFPEKEAARGRATDALGFYHSMLLLPLVEALRMRWCPERWSFGLRYLDHDLPGDVAARLKDLAYPRDLEDLRHKAARARAWLAEELALAAD